MFSRPTDPHATSFTPNTLSRPRIIQQQRNASACNHTAALPLSTPSQTADRDHTVKLNRFRVEQSQPKGFVAPTSYLNRSTLRLDLSRVRLQTDVNALYDSHKRSMMASQVILCDRVALYCYWCFYRILCSDFTREITPDKSSATGTYSTGT